MGMSLFLLEFSSNAFGSRKTPVPFDNGQGFPTSCQSFPKETHSKYLPVPLES